jgi:hypothetical protein
LYPLFKIWTPGQSIGFVVDARAVDDGERKLGEKEGPAGLTTGKFLFGAEILEVAMVGPNFKRFGVAFEVVAKGLKGADNGKEFFVVDVIILFGIDQGL